MAELTVYPDADPESTSVDGYVYRSGVDETWATIIAAAGITANDNWATAFAGYVRCSATSNQYARLYRGKFRFDTSALPDDASISATVFSLYGLALSSNNFSQELAVCSHSGGSDTTVAAADFARANFGLTDFAPRIAMSAWSVGAYNDFTFNATGRAAVSKTGITCLGTMMSGDIDGAGSPPVPWASDAHSRAEVSTAEQAGTDQDPKLVITYSTGGTTHEGAGTANLAISTAGAALKTLLGAGTAILTIETAGAGLKTLYGSASALLELAASGAGLKTLLGAGTATLTLTTYASATEYDALGDLGVGISIVDKALAVSIADKGLTAEKKGSI